MVAGLAVAVATACGRDEERIGTGAANEGALDGGGADAASADAGVPAYKICDGSMGIRLFASTISGSGLVAPYAPLVEPHGRFLAVTGGCQFFVAHEPLEGVRSGVLSAVQEERLARELHLGQLSSWVDYEDVTTCYDAPSTFLSNGNAIATCRCGDRCADDAPAGLAAAVSAYRDLNDELWNAGSLFEGALQATAQTESPEGPASAFTWFEWPLPWDIGEIAEESLSYVGQSTRMVSGEEAATLRALRSTAHSNPLLPRHYVPVETLDGRRFRLFLHDELPMEIDSALSALLDPAD
jgi:hypothetical protein